MRWLWRRALARALAATSDAGAASAVTAVTHRAGTAAPAATLTAATLALAAGLLSPTSCSSPADPSAARAAVASAWAALDEDLHRAEAGLGSLGHFLLPPPRPPTVAPDGDGSGRVLVTIPIRGGAAAADPGSILAACAAACGPGGAHLTSTPGGALTLTHTPPGDARAAVEVSVSSSSGTVEVSAWPADLAAAGGVGAAVLGAALRAANTIVQESEAGGARSFSWSRSWSSEGGEGGGNSPLLELGDLLLRGPLEELLKAAGEEGGDERAKRRPTPTPSSSTPALPRAVIAAIADLERFGCTVTLPSSPPSTSASSSFKPHWDSFAGYAAQKRQVEEAMLPLAHPELCDGVAAAARAPAVMGGASASPSGLTRPRAILFAGPPGCGKTTAAAIAAAAAGAPLIYVPVEGIVSKFYGEAEQRLAGVFEAARALAAGWGVDTAQDDGGSGGQAARIQGKALLFLDEVDSLATSRGGDMHEATRRVLGVLLRALDGAPGSGRGLVTVLATNRPEDCDPALMSRCGARVVFPLPDGEARAGIVRLYAAHLPPAGVSALAAASTGLSGRAIRDACEAAERAWAARLLAQGGGGKVEKPTPPPVEVYLRAVEGQKGV